MTDESFSTKPDPTARTLATLQHEVAGLSESTNLIIKGVEEVVAVKFDSVAEKFSSINIQLSLIERQRVEQKGDTANAVAAALTAQKEAVREQTIASERAIAKSEMATGKQLDQMTQTFDASMRGVIELLNDVKDRISKLDTRVSNIETSKQSVAAAQTESRGGVTTAVAVISAVVAGLSVVASVVIAMVTAI